MLKLHETLEEVFSPDYVRESKYISKAKNGFITVDDAVISFTMQQGAVKERGLNGVQTEEIMEFLIGYLSKLNQSFPCKDNEKSIMCIQQALLHQHARKLDREERGVEGLEKA